MAKLVYKLNIFSLTTPVYWILVSLYSGFSPSLKDDFVVTGPDGQLGQTLVPIYYMTHNESLYIVLSQNQTSNNTRFYIKNNIWKKIYQNNNLEITKPILFDISKDYFKTHSIQIPNSTLFNSVFDSIPSQFAPPEYVRNLFLDKFNLTIIKNDQFTYTDLPPLTNG
nr:hypothetical protein [Abalone asfa-like virus]